MTSKLALLSLVTMSATACTKAPSPSPASPRFVAADTVVRVDTVRVETEARANAQLEERMARLQIELLGRDVQLQELQQQLDETRQEVVRNMAKLQSQASRAEAASGISEAEIALQALATSRGTDVAEYAQARSLVAQSSAEFGSDNYGGALYLATQARTLARAGQARVRGGSSGTARSGEALFAVPVPLHTSGRSNVRWGPGLTSAVAFTLDEGTPVLGHSYTSQWVRVETEDGREGWIFHTLVAGRSR